MVGFVSGIVELNCGFGIVGYYGKLKNTYSKIQYNSKEISNGFLRD